MRPDPRWAELRAFAGNISYGWPLVNEQQAAFENFARIFNATGTQARTSGTSHIPADKGAGALLWLHKCVFGSA